MATGTDNNCGGEPTSQCVNHMFDVVIISDTFDCVVPIDHNGFNSQEL